MSWSLLDFGDGRRLDRFGDITLDRPAPAVADLAPASPRAWAAADARFDKTTGWQPAGGVPAAWNVEIAGVRLELRPTPAGQVGLFPEHVAPAAAAAREVETLARDLGRPVEALNLFAYTGLASLLLARAGARVAHVDASKPAVAWARRNAAVAGLDAAPVRWLVEDALAFTAREARRGRHYDVVILDPPTYGHAPRGGGPWHLDAGLAALLEACAAVTGPRPRYVLLTAHATGLRPGDLRAAVGAAWGPALAAEAAIEPLGPARPDGAVLPAGVSVIVRA